MLLLHNLSHHFGSSISQFGYHKPLSDLFELKVTTIFLKTIEIEKKYVTQVQSKRLFIYDIIHITLI